MKNQLIALSTTLLTIFSLSFIEFDANAQCNGNVSWTGVGGASISGTTITRNNGSSNWGSCGAYDLQAVGSGGFVQFQGGQTNKARMLGINSDYAANRSYSSIDYAWYLRSNATLRIYENGSNKGDFGTYTANDVFKVYWNPFNNKVEYYQNDVLIYTSATTPSGTKYVDCSIYHNGGKFTNVTVAGGDCLDCPAPVDWIGHSGGGVNSDGTSITFTSGSCWASGAYSMHPVKSGGFIQFQTAQNNKATMVGINSDPTSNHSYSSLDYAWYLVSNGQPQVRENGSSKGYKGTYSANDVFMIYWNPTNNKIEYYKNTVKLYTSTITPSATLYADLSFCHAPSTIYNVVVSGGGCSYTEDFF